MSGEVVNQLLLLFFLMLVGFAAKKLRFIDKTTADKLSGFIANVTMPLLYVSTLMQRYTFDRMAAGGAVFGLSALYYAIAIFVGYLFVRLTRTPEKERGVLEFMIIFPNAAYMGYPVLSAVFFQAPEEAVFYGVFFNLLFNLLAFTIGVWKLGSYGGKGKRFDWKSAFNPGTISVFVGLFFFFISSLLPAPVYNVLYEGFFKEALSALGNTTIPLSMVVIGSVLADMDLKKAFGYWRIYLVVALRLILLPLIMLGVTRLLHLSGLIGGVPVVISAMPCAVFAVILSKQYGGDEELASVGVFMTTLLSAATIPIFAYLLQMA